MIKQAFAKNYMPSGGGGNYKYYKINNSEIISKLINPTKVPIIDAIIEGELCSFIKVLDASRDQISALRTDNSYNYSVDMSEIIGKPNSYISVTGDLVKLIKLVIELFETPKEEQDRILSMFQEISKGEYEAMIKK